MAVLVSQDELPHEVALNNFVRKLLPHRVTTDLIDRSFAAKVSPTASRPIYMSPAPEK